MAARAMSARSRDREIARSVLPSQRATGPDGRRSGYSARDPGRDPSLEPPRGSVRLLIRDRRPRCCPSAFAGRRAQNTTGRRDRAAMAPPSRLDGREGRAHRRTTPGRVYQVPPRTGRSGRAGDAQVGWPRLSLARGQARSPHAGPPSWRSGPPGTAQTASMTLAASDPGLAQDLAPSGTPSSCGNREQRAGKPSFRA